MNSTAAAAVADLVPAPVAGGGGDAAALVDFLRERNIECPLCRYNLRGLRSPRCPECGRDLELRIGLSEPRQGAWLVCQVALSGAGGIGVLAGVMILKDGWPQEENLQWLFNVSMVAFLLAIPLAVLALVLRRRYLRMKLGLQRALAVLAAVAAVGALIGLAGAS